MLPSKLRLDEQSLYMEYFVAGSAFVCFASATGNRDDVFLYRSNKKDTVATEVISLDVSEV